ncbi:MAG: TIGR03960 family B12-binding radical SAM protein [Candidatus Ancaeobacter aquaticus]|nr:TIGR03960 family B12-binding radical SAM protein [Candidatus Ancaeobacter aquaticus]
MNLRQKVIEDILPYVEKPGRYIGNEVNTIIKDLKTVDVRIALAFPDVYEIGMSHYGLKILYEIINNVKEFSAQRVFAPWPDMEECMRKEAIPLFSLENYTPLLEHDIVGFSVQYELCYTNILNMLNLAGIPLKSAERVKGSWPLIIGGGPCVFNPEPIADFFDAFFIGESEETLLQFMHLVSKNKDLSKEKLLEKAAQTISGIYVPRLFNKKISQEGRFSCYTTACDTTPKQIKKAVVKDLNDIPSPKKQIVPLISIIHDRATLEIMRGCGNACRFCQAGSIYRPLRYRKKDVLVEEAKEIIANTGYQEISLSSLSTGDYPDIEGLVDDLTDNFYDKKVSLSIPSLRVDTFSVELARKISKIKKTGFTFACEAGTQRMLEIIRKNIRLDDLYKAVEYAYSSGWNLIKLYFMIGLPGETYDDLDNIMTIVNKVSEVKRSLHGKPGRVNVSISNFVPKTHTPLQWAGMNSIDEFRQKHIYLKKKIKRKCIQVKFHNIEKSFVEALFSRGDRSLSQIVLDAWKEGAKFDDWYEYFNFSTWQKVIERNNLETNKYIDCIDVKEVLPWEFISTGSSTEALIKEYEDVQQKIGEDAI